LVSSLLAGISCGNSQLQTISVDPGSATAQNGSVQYTATGTYGDGS